MIECINRKESVCLLASSLTGVVVSIDEKTCNACIKDSHPQVINKVICSISLKATRDKKYIELWHKCNNSFFNRPGSILKNILQKIGIASEKECGCDEFAVKMNTWGTVGCTEHRSEIIDHLNSKDITWWDMARVALAGYLTTGQLVDECIELSKIVYKPHQE